MLTLLRRISNISTGKYILAAYILASISIIMSRLGKLIPYGADLAVNMVKWTVMAMFSLSYCMMWVLLVVGLLRPHSLFTSRGERGSRVANFLYALGGLVILHGFVAFKIATSGS